MRCDAALAPNIKECMTETPVATFPEGERLDRIRLARTPNIGPITFRQLIGRFGSAGDAIEALPALIRRAGGRRRSEPPSRAAAGEEADRVRQLGGTLLVFGEASYPTPLANIDDAPPVLAVLGDPSLLQRPAVAVVGARNASTNGRRMAADLASRLGAAGYVVVSGLARGIDAAVHDGALATGTAAVMAGGIDVIYPPEHRDLARRIAETGAVVSEMPPGTEPQARHFPRRNRIISGLSLGVVVVEAARRSGSLITARLALEQGREVLAVPGSPLDPRAQGCNDLIKKGAVLVQDAGDIVAELESRSAVAELPRDLLAETPTLPADGDLDQARSVILAHLSPTPTPVDELIRHCQLSASVARTALLELELAGRVERQPGNRVALI